MRNDLFFMATSVLSVWKEGSFKLHSAVTCVTANDEEYKTYLFNNSEDGLEVILDVFGDKDLDLAGSKLFITRVPSQIFLKAAKQKKVSKVYYLKNLENYVVPDEFAALASVFQGNFGKIIDTFEQIETIGTNTHKYTL